MTEKKENIEKKTCPNCGSKNLIKKGTRKNKLKCNNKNINSQKMKENSILQAPNFGFYKAPNLEKIKDPNLGCEISLENGILLKTIEKTRLFKE